MVLGSSEWPLLDGDYPMTTIWDFEAQMVKEGRIQDYALTDVPIQGDGLPNNVTVIAPLGDGSGGWTVFFTKRVTSMISAISRASRKPAILF